MSVRSVMVVAAVLMISMFLGRPAAASGSGLNDWSCKPSASHPEPVVLVHAQGAPPEINWIYMGPKIADAGFCTYWFTYGRQIFGLVPGFADMAESAGELRAFVDQVLSATGASKVDLVAQSEGSTISAYYLKKLGGVGKVDQLIAFSANYQGTTFFNLTNYIHELTAVLPGLAGFVYDEVCTACLQFLPPSAFLDSLNEGGTAAVPGVRYTNMVSRLDEVVTPYTSGAMSAPNANNIVLQDSCPVDFVGHVAQAIDPNVLGQVLHALDPVNPTVCQLVTAPF